VQEAISSVFQIAEGGLPILEKESCLKKYFETAFFYDSSPKGRSVT
jgi:hypothetical protein